MQLTKSKKIILSIVALLMIVSTIFVLTACGEETQKETTAEVGTYQELVTALEGDDDIIKLTDDIVVKDVVVVTREVELDLNGKTLSNETALWDETTPGANKWSVVSVRGEGDLTITGNGTIHALENDCYALDVMDADARLVIENGTFVGNISAVYAFQGTVEIKGGEYSIQQLDNNYHDERFTLNCYDDNYTNGTASIVVTGGVFHDFNPANNLAELPSANFVAEGYTAQLVEGSETDYEVVKA